MTTPPAASVGLAQASALYIAAVLGTGILVLPALTATAAGPASVLAVVAVMVLSVPLAGTFAALASRHPDSGGVATYLRLALGPTAARMTGYWFFFGVCVGTPVVAILGSTYVVSIFGGDRWVVVVVAVLLLIPPFVSNAGGVRVSGSVQLVLSGVLVVIVVVVVTIAAPASDAANFRPFLPNGWVGVGAAISLFVWAFAGWEAVTHIAAEFKNPRRTIPAATAIAIVAVGGAYIALQVVTVAVLGDRAGDTDVPLVELVATSAPGIGPALVAGVAAVLALGVLNTYLGAFAKLGASLGRDGDLPRWLGAGAEPGGIPRRSLVVVGALAATYLTVLVLTDLDLTPFILIHTSSIVGVYALGMVAAVRILPRFSVGWWLAVVSVLLVAGLVVLAGPNLLVPATLAVAAVVVTIVQRRRRDPVSRAL